MDLCGLYVDHTWQSISDPVDEQLSARNIFLRKDDAFAGRVFPLFVLGTEATVAVAIRVFRTVDLSPYVLQILSLT